MSQENVLKTLESLGLSQFDAQVYVFLGKRGPQKARDVSKSLRIPKQRLYLILKNLQGKGIVNFTLEHPAKFSAVSFEKVLDLFVKAKMEEAQRIQQGKTEILSDWQSIAIEETGDQSARFTVLEGRNYIYPKLRQMIEETKNQLLIISTVPGLIRADQFGLLDASFNRSSKLKIQLRFLTELSEQNVNALKSLLGRTRRTGFSFEGRVPELGLKMFTRIVIRDDKEAVFFITPGADRVTEEDADVCLWTNCKSLVDSFSAVFEELWKTSQDIQKKIAEIETGKPTPKMNIISDAEIAQKRYHDAMHSAKKEILILTSSKGLIATWKGTSLLSDWAQRGVSVRIMAHITSENLEAARQLLKCCEIRHVPAGYLATTIVDGDHLFQFKNTASEGEETQSAQYFENTFYTNDAEYVRKTENMLNDIWNNAQAPSFIALKAVIQQPLSSKKPANASILEEYTNQWKRIVGFSYIMEPQESKITEKEILNKIADAQRIPAKDPKRDIIRAYGTQGIAIIYPPKNFNLPNFMVFVLHSNRQSSFGVENSLLVYMQAEIADDMSYLPVAFVTDNPRGYKFRKAMYKLHRTTEVAHLLRKDELKVQAQGNRLFAGWTVPIPLLPPKYVLPPSCIMFEGYGKVKSVSSKIIGPLNRRLTYEENILDAFVTFMHPTSRYYGPGSDGLLHRDMIVTSYPAAE